MNDPKPLHPDVPPDPVKKCPFCGAPDEPRLVPGLSGVPAFLIPHMCLGSKVHGR